MKRWLLEKYYRWLNAWRDSGMLAYNVHTRYVAPNDMTEILGPAEERRPLHLNPWNRLLYAIRTFNIRLPQSANAGKSQPANDSPEERQKHKPKPCLTSKPY